MMIAFTLLWTTLSLWVADLLTLSWGCAEPAPLPASGAGAAT
jgi:hypothetical protein